MADSTIHDLPPVTSLTATDTVPVDQGLVTRKSTVQQFIAFSGGINVSNSIHGAPSKTTPADLDEVGITDSASAFSLAKLSWADLRTAIASFMSSSGNSFTATKLQTIRTIDGQNFDGTANITVVAPATNAAATKTTPVTNDKIPLADSATGFTLKSLTWGNLVNTISTAITNLVVNTLTVTGTSTLSGNATFDQQTWTDTTSPHESITVRSNHQGTISGTAVSFNRISIPNDFADCSGTVNNVAAVQILENFGGSDPSRGGASAKGGRTGFRVSQVQQGSTIGSPAPGTASYQYVAGEFWSTAQFNLGGTDFAANPSGTFYGMNPQVIGGGTATFLAGIIGGEIDIALTGGATSRRKVGLQTIQLNIDTTAGAGYGGVNPTDAFYVCGQQRPAGAVNGIPPMIYGFRIGDVDMQWPFGTSSTIIGAVTQTIANGGGAPILPMNAKLGVDFSNITFTGAGSGAFKSNGFLVSGLGQVTALGVSLGNNGVAVNSSDNSSTAIIANPGIGVVDTYTQSGTAGSVDVIITRTETSLGSGLHKFIDCQITGTGSVASIDNKGGASFLYEKTTAALSVNNGATTTYTYPNDTAYVYLTTTAASLAITLPAAAAELDGFIATICPSASMGTVTWASTGATFVGAPASLTANTPVKLRYIHSQLKWYPS